MKPLPLLLIIVLIASCGCLDTAPQHDFEINETREFWFTHSDNLTYRGNLTWDGDRFFVCTIMGGHIDGRLWLGGIRGYDDAAGRLLCVLGGDIPPEIWAVDLRHTALLEEMIAHCE